MCVVPRKRGMHMVAASGSLGVGDCAHPAHRYNPPLPTPPPTAPGLSSPSSRFTPVHLAQPGSQVKYLHIYVQYMIYTITSNAKFKL